MEDGEPNIASTFSYRTRSTTLPTPSELITVFLLMKLGIRKYET